MTIDELKALFLELEKQGLNPMLCDMEIPMYDASVPCGNPTMCSGDNVEMKLFPKELMSLQPEFMVSVKGDSMKDADIISGDVVKVVSDTNLYDCDIVLAYIDGEYTLKAYCEDDEGQKWLVPQNEAYHPILLDGKTNVMIYGKVAEIVKKAPRVSHKQCIKAIRKERMAAAKAQQISSRRVKTAIREMAQCITIGRQWYAVYRAMVDYEVAQGGISEFCERIRRLLPEHEHLPEQKELSRMAVQSFAKPVAMWQMDNAPVGGSRYRDYLNIALAMGNLLGSHDATKTPTQN